ncbi:MAG: YafY family transcriptional regulator [Spirochaetes bacterium]|nr:YafY family transcriptional regulator [Spirochaetota bacterium]
MKIDRLLSIIIYLLNRNLVSARELADHFEVSHRTIQRDMETINAAGIPIVTIQGPAGGYSIMDTWKMDRQLLSVDDLFFIMTSLSSISKTLPDSKLRNSIEKVQTLVREHQKEALSEREEKLYVDFSMIGGMKQNQELVALVQHAIENHCLLQVEYTSNKLITQVRKLEPMTLVFKWRGWYLYAFCRLRNDFRLFRMSRIRNPQLLKEHFSRKNKSFKDFEEESEVKGKVKMTELLLKFDPFMKPVVEDFMGANIVQTTESNEIIVKISIPEDGWLYGFLLSYGPYLEVLSPPHIRAILGEMSQKIHEKYVKS